MRGPLLWLGFCASQRVSNCNSSCAQPSSPSFAFCIVVVVAFAFSSTLLWACVCGNVLGDIVNIFLETGIAVRRTRLAGRAKKQNIHTHTHTNTQIKIQRQRQNQGQETADGAGAGGGIMADRYLLRRSCSECIASEFLALSRHRTWATMQP